MSIETTESLLNRFDYVYERTSELIEIKLGLGLRITVDFSQPEKVIIKDELTTWNFLTGTLDMSLNRGIIFNFIATFVFTGLFFIGFNKDFYIITSIILLVFIFIVLLWSNFYLVKAEQMKQTLRRWNEI
jgi:hypothetical protein